MRGARNATCPNTMALNFVHSDKTLSALAKQLHKQLVPTNDDLGSADVSAISAILPVSILEGAIRELAERHNYGLDPNSVGAGRIPAALYIWRWEVKPERRDWLPKSIRSKVEMRIAEREQVRTRSLISDGKILMVLSGKEGHSIPFRGSPAGIQR
jgi:hypothetical protein